MVPWTGLELIVIVLFIYFFWPILVYTLLSAIDFFGWLYGPGFTQHIAEASGSPEHTAEEERVKMWRAVLCVPLNVATVVGLCALLSGTRPYQLGLTTHRLGRNVLLGCFSALLAAPLHFLNDYVSVWYQQVLHAPPTPHALTVIAQHALPVDRVLIVVSAVVAAPVIEELVFRGLLQPWFNRRRFGGILAILFALGLALRGHWNQLEAAWTGANWRDLALALQPAAFVLLLAPGLLLTRRLSRPEAAGGIYGTAVLFAAAHSPFWPSPVPLLPLGLVLGWLAYRTNSIVGPMVLHSMFNGIACIMMLVFIFP